METEPSRDAAADVGAIAFLIFYTVLLVVMICALWISYAS
jgi:hypothetical protein